VVNEKGAQRAIETEKVRTLGFPYSVSPSFLQKNQNQGLDEAIETLETIEQKALDAGLGLVVYISMAFGNPYGDLWSVEEVLEAIDLLSEMQIEQVSLADTVGIASPQQIADAIGPVTERFSHLEIGAHLHSRPADAAERIRAAYSAGCRRFDSALGGLGGCPFAQDELVGNIPTETVVAALRDLEVESPIRKPLDAVLKMSQAIAMGSPSAQIQ